MTVIGVASGAIIAIVGPINLSAALLGLVTLLLSIPFGIAWCDRRIDIFAPVYITAVSLWLAYGMNGLQILYWPETYRPLQGVDVFSAPLTVPLACIALGVVAYLLGYYLGVGTALIATGRRIRLTAQRPISTGGIVLLAAIAWASRIVGLSAGRTPSFATFGASDAGIDKIYYHAGFLGLYAYSLIWISVMSRRSFTGAAGVALVAIGLSELAFTLAQGSKTYLIWLLLIPLITAQYQQRRATYGKLLIAAAVVVFVIFPYVGSFRDEFLARTDAGSDPSSATTMADSVGAAWREMYSQRSSRDPGWLEFMARWGGIGPTVAVLDLVPGVGKHTFGRDLIQIPFALVPRVLVPDKPIAQAPSYFAQQLLGIYGAGISPFPVAEAYLNFGIVGIPVCLFLLGALQRLYYSLLTEPTDQLKLFVYIWTFLEITNVNTWLLNVIVGLIQIFAVLLAVVIFVGGRFTIEPRFRVKLQTIS